MLFTSKLMVIFRSGFFFINSGSVYELKDLVDLKGLDLISIPLSRQFIFSLLGLRAGDFSCSVMTRAQFKALTGGLLAALSISPIEGV